MFKRLNLVDGKRILTVSNSKNVNWAQQIENNETELQFTLKPLLFECHTVRCNHFVPKSAFWQFSAKCLSLEPGIQTHLGSYTLTDLCCIDKPCRQHKGKNGNCRLPLSWIQSFQSHSHAFVLLCWNVVKQMSHCTFCTMNNEVNENKKRSQNDWGLSCNWFLPDCWYLCLFNVSDI